MCVYTLLLSIKNIINVKDMRVCSLNFNQMTNIRGMSFMTVEVVEEW